MELHLDLKTKGYPVFLDRGAFSHFSRFINLNSKVLILTDDGIPECHVKTASAQCEHAAVLTVKQGEGAKSFPVFEDICKKLLDLKFGRNDLLIAVGGGVIGDLGGFSASCYMRGIRFVNMPTTSLSQIDSSIGGKTAINLNGVKNAVGSFYQPEAVVADPDVLSTLPTRHLNNGLVEAVKAGLIGDAALFSLFENTDVYSHIDEIIHRSLLVKKRVVEQDEKEQGLRKTLNFGHTIGHGVESVYGLSGLLHGESVAVGMLPMIDDPTLRERVRAVLKKIGVDPDLSYDADAVYEATTRDKKTHGNSISIIRVNHPGEAQICEVETASLKPLLRRNAQ